MSITQRIDATTHIPPEYLSPTPPAPRSVKIELSARCNYRCGFCALRTRQVQPKEDMDFEFFKRLCREMREVGVEELGVFYLGESFMNPDLLEDAIRFAKQDAGFPYVFLTSNASLAFPTEVRRCFDAGLDSLKWSVNYADEAQFAEIAGVSPKYFWRSVLNIQDARRLRDEGGYRCGLYASSIRYDGEQLARMRQFLEEHIIPYVDEHYWLPLYSMGSLATQREEQMGFRPIAGNQGRLEALRDPLPCWSAFTEGHITAQGLLSACCFDADSRWNMGDLNRMGFMEAWHSLPFQQLRKAHLARDVSGTVCQACVAYK